MCTGRQYLSVVGAMILMCAPNGFAHAADSALPPGVDPGGTAIALITTGIDYTDPQIASRLARDGEGQLIGWDFVDNDIAPFADDPLATSLAKLLLETNHDSRLVIVRVSPGNTQQFANALAFVARTPAVIVAAPVPTGPILSLTLAKELAATLNPIVVILPATDSPAGETSGVEPDEMRNVVVAASLDTHTEFLSNRPGFAPTPMAQVDAWVLTNGIPDLKISVPKLSTPNALATVILAAKAGCLVNGDRGLRYSEDLRTRLLDQARPHPPKTSIKVHDPNCGQTRPGPGK